MSDHTEAVNDMIKLIIAGIVIIIAVLALFYLRPHDTAFHRNVRPGVTKILCLILIILIIAAGVYIFFSVRKEGVGALIVNRGNTETVGTSESDGETVEIRISTDHFTIGRQKFSSVSEAAEVLRQAVKDGKQFLLVDDYASVTMYMGVKNGLISLGVSPDDIREFKEP